MQIKLNNQLIIFISNSKRLALSCIKYYKVIQRNIKVCYLQNFKRKELNFSIRLFAMQSKQQLKQQLRARDIKTVKEQSRQISKQTKGKQSKHMKQEFHQNQKKIKNAPKDLKTTISPEQYSSFNVKYLGNHSSWKKTTSSNRYNDPRLKYLNPDFFLNKYVLDIGCNQGFLDIQVAMRFFPKQVYAIDICYKLIKNARRNLYNIVSKDKNYQEKINMQNSNEQQNSKKSTLHQKISASHQKLKVQKQTQKMIDDNMCKRIQDLPLFFQDRLKNKFSLQCYLPRQVKIFSQQMLKAENRFPLNLKFDAQNIYTIKYQQDKLQYDTIVCLKVTKWIHLSYGDQGIRGLFQKIYDLLRVDGILIFQAQDWGSYKRKKNMHDFYRSNYDNIKFGPNEFQKTLVNDPLKEFKFELIQKFEQSDKNQKEQNRIDYPIMVFRKMSTMLYY